jgi:hypothetical protein
LAIHDANSSLSAANGTGSGDSHQQPRKRNQALAAAMKRAWDPLMIHW